MIILLTKSTEHSFRTDSDFAHLLIDHLVMTTQSIHRYKLGEEALDHHLEILNQDEASARLSASKLKIGEGAFIKRSDSKWRYAEVISASESFIEFIVSPEGCTKKVAASHWSDRICAHDPNEVSIKYTKSHRLSKKKPSKIYLSNTNVGRIYPHTSSHVENKFSESKEVFSKPKVSSRGKSNPCRRYYSQRSSLTRKPGSNDEDETPTHAIQYDSKTDYVEVGVLDQKKIQTVQTENTYSDCKLTECVGAHNKSPRDAIDDEVEAIDVGDVKGAIPLLNCSKNCKSEPNKELKSPSTCLHIVDVTLPIIEFEKQVDNPDKIGMRPESLNIREKPQFHRRGSCVTTPGNYDASEQSSFDAIMDMSATGNKDIDLDVSCEDHIACPPCKNLSDKRSKEMNDSNRDPDEKAPEGVQPYKFEPIIYKRNMFANSTTTSDIFKTLMESEPPDDFFHKYNGSGQGKPQRPSMQYRRVSVHGARPTMKTERPIRTSRRASADILSNPLPKASKSVEKEPKVVRQSGRDRRVSVDGIRPSMKTDYLSDNTTCGRAKAANLPYGRSIRRAAAADHRHKLSSSTIFKNACVHLMVNH